MGNGMRRGRRSSRVCTSGDGEVGSDLIRGQPVSAICPLVNGLFVSAVFSTLGDHLRFATIERTTTGSFLEEPRCSIIVKPQTSTANHDHTDLRCWRRDNPKPVPQKMPTDHFKMAQNHPRKRKTWFETRTPKQEIKSSIFTLG